MQGFVERVSRRAVHGWARDPARPETRLTVEAVVDGVVLATAIAEQFRGDVADAGLGDGNCGFRLDLSAHALLVGNRTLVVRQPGGTVALAGTPRDIADSPALLAFLQRSATIPPAVQARLARMMRHRTAASGVSVVLRLADIPPERLAAMLRALAAQWHDRWQAVCIADTPGQLALLSGPRDPRIRVLAPGSRTGLADAMNLGLRAANQALTVFLTEPACLEPDAAYHLARAHRQPGVLSWDDALTHLDRGGVTDARCRGAFSPDLLATQGDLGSGFAVTTELARAIAGWRDGTDATADFCARAVAAAQTVTHLPRLLARCWVAGSEPTDECPPRPVPALTGGTGEVLIVIPTRDKADLLARCIDSLRATIGDLPHRIVVIDHQSEAPATQAYLARAGVTVEPYVGPFNYAAMNNQAVRAHAGAARHVLFLNNDTEALHPGWLHRLRALSDRPGIGAVGCLLLYEDRRVQHAGVVLGIGGVAGHAFAHDAAYRNGQRLAGPLGLLTALRDVSAVTAACMIMRLDAFHAVGGYDEGFAVGFNDTDLCLRLRKRGFRILYDGQTVLLHHESRTRRQTGQILHEADSRRFRRRWRAILAAGDPYYSPHLNLIAADWELRETCAPIPPPRRMHPDGTPWTGRRRKLTQP